MRAPLRLSLAALALAAAASTAACHNPFCSKVAYDSAPRGGANNGATSSSGGNATPVQNAGTNPTSEDAARVIAEADIVQLDQVELRIYAMSKSGAVAIVDASTPGSLTLLGKSSISGEPFEMYRRGNVLLTMSNRAVTGTGQVKDPLPPDEGFTIPPEDPTASAVIAAVDVSDPAQIRTTATFKVPGEIADSRIVGSVLYLATYENGACYGCSDSRTVVTSFDISNPLSPTKIDQVGFLGSAGVYKRSVIATTSRFYVGGVSANAQTASDEGQIDILDITDTTGLMTKGAKITVPGPITSRWQMDESDGYLRVISERGVLTSRSGTAYPDIDTFRIESSSSLVRVGHSSMTLPTQEALKTVRFDGTRAFAITFQEKDPLFTIDLSDPANPRQAGQLAMPGWIFDLEPKGSSLIGLGLDRTDNSGNLNVSVIDVTSLSSPRLVDRVSFGPTTGYTDAQITQGILAEDQDRIQKAFRIFSDGLIAVPYSSATQCAANGAGVQLLSWTPSTLTRHATIPMSGNPRRAVRRDSDVMQELIAISDSNVSSFQIDNRDAASPTANVVIGKCVARTVTPQGTGIVGDGHNPGDVYDPSGGYGYDPSGSSCE